MPELATLLAALISLLVGYWLGLMRDKGVKRYELMIGAAASYLEQARKCLGHFGMKERDEAASERPELLRRAEHLALFVGDETSALVKESSETYARLSLNPKSELDPFHEWKRTIAEVEQGLRGEIHGKGFWAKLRWSL